MWAPYAELNVADERRRYIITEWPSGLKVNKEQTKIAKEYDK